VGGQISINRSTNTGVYNLNGIFTNAATITIGAVTGGTAPYTYSVDGSAFTATLVYNNLSG